MIKIIEKAKLDGDRVCVHCTMGRGRTGNALRIGLEDRIGLLHREYARFDQCPQEIVQ